MLQCIGFVNKHFSKHIAFSVSSLHPISLNIFYNELLALKVPIDLEVGGQFWQLFVWQFDFEGFDWACDKGVKHGSAFRFFIALRANLSVHCSRISQKSCFPI